MASAFDELSWLSCTPVLAVLRGHFSHDEIGDVKKQPSENSKNRRPCCFGRASLLEQILEGYFVIIIIIILNLFIIFFFYYI